MTRYDEINAIIAATGKRHNLDLTRIMNGGRRAHIVAARAEAMFRVKERFNLSFPHVGRIFGRDHTSVVNLYWKVKRALGGSDWLDLDDDEVTKIVIEVFTGPLAKAEKAAPEPEPEPDAEDAPSNALPIEFYAELRRAAKINSIWRKKGIEAHARVILQDGAPVLVSDLCLAQPKQRGARRAA